MKSISSQSHDLPSIAPASAPRTQTPLAGRAAAAREAAPATGSLPQHDPSCRWPRQRVVDPLPSALRPLQRPTRRKILSVSAVDFASAELQVWADESASHEECTQLMVEVVGLFEEIRTLTTRLRKACSHMMCIYVLAHHTTGAGWDTVAQLCYREEWDRKMLAVQDGFVPLRTWEEKVTAAMLWCKQDKHLSKDGVPLGPVCPRLAWKFSPRAGSSPRERARPRLAPGNFVHPAEGSSVEADAEIAGLLVAEAVLQFKRELVPTNRERQLVLM